MSGGAIVWMLLLCTVTGIIACARLLHLCLRLMRYITDFEGGCVCAGPMSGNGAPPESCEVCARAFVNAVRREIGMTVSGPAKQHAPNQRPPKYPRVNGTYAPLSDEAQQHLRTEAARIFGGEQ